MALLQHALSDSEMELVFSCMDSHGYITPEQVRCVRVRQQHVHTPAAFLTVWLSSHAKARHTRKRMPRLCALRMCMF
jgi:hypothetical protein